MKKIGILYHPMNESAHALATELKDFLLTRGIAAWLCSAWEETSARCQLDGTELILSVGGDGTILRAAQVAGNIPITGINMGNLGFMTELKAEEAETKLIDLLEGRGWLDERAMLETEMSPEHGPEGAPRVYYALNDIVLARGNIVRLVTIDTSINDEHFATYRADGLILATATGSTGYSLAAGGPILYPQASEFVLTPILPHLSPSYSLVLPSATVVKLSLKAAFPATLSIDGHINLPVNGGITITVKRSSQSIRFLRVHPKTSFYHTLEQKLKGKQTG